MNKWLKRAGIAVLSLVALAAGALVVGGKLGQRKMQRHLAVKLDAVAYRSDAVSVERGRYLCVAQLRRRGAPRTG